MEEGIPQKVIEREKLEALNKDADFGKLIPVDDAEALIRHINSDNGRYVLEAYNESTDPENKIAIRHYGAKYSNPDRIYIIGKSREDKRIEITLKGGYVFGPHQKWQNLEIHLKYDGDDIKFQPKVLDKYDTLLKRGEYGATIRITEDPKGVREKLLIREEPLILDERLNEKVDQVYQSIYVASDKKYLGLPRGRRLNKDFSLEQLSEEIEKITGLAKALEEQEKFEHNSLIFDYDWHSKDRLVDLALFPEEDMAVYAIFRYYQERRYGSYLIQEQDEITVGLIIEGESYRTTIRDNTIDFRRNLQTTHIRGVRIINRTIDIDIRTKSGEYQQLEFTRDK